MFGRQNGSDVSNRKVVRRYHLTPDIPWTVPYSVRMGADVRAFSP